MKYLTELSKEEALQIQGGSAYEIGKAIGKWCANCVDFYEGMWDAFFG